jgi:GTP:adenosylcobinamide-phosphate guanylyltransferase
MRTKPTTERLAEALHAAGCPAAMIRRAREGYYDDYKSPLATPCMQLVSDLENIGQRDLANRARNGEFDGTREEAEAWARSPDGQAAFRDLLGGR